MSLASIGGNIAWPATLINNINLAGNYAVGLSAVTFDSDTDRIAYVGISPIADTLSKIYWRAGTVTSPAVADVRVETWGADGKPSGTLFGTNSNVTITPSGSNTWQTCTLTTAPTFAIGSKFAINVVRSSGTFDGTHLFNMQRMAANTAGSGNFPLCIQDTGAGTWANLAGNLCMILEFTTGSVIYIPGLSPVDVGSSHGAFNNTSNPNEVALQFRVPFKCRAVGIQWGASNIVAGANFTCSLWDTGTTDAGALAQIGVDGDAIASTTQESPATCFFATTQPTLSPGTTYYAGVRPDTANNIDVLEMRSPSGITNSMRGFAIPTDGFCQKATRLWDNGAPNTAGAWTTAGANANILPLISVLVDQLDNGAGGGGLLTHPGMSGGMRG